MKPPYIKLTYDNGFQDVYSVKATVPGQTLDEIMEVIKGALMGIGFSPELVNEYWSCDWKKEEK